MKEKLLKHFRLLWFLALLAFVIGGSVLYNGDPFTRMRLNKESVEYVQENYPGIAEKVKPTSEVYTAHHNMKPLFFANFCHVDNRYIRFSLVYDRYGNLIRDDFKNAVGISSSIYQNLSGRYTQMVKNRFNDTFRDGTGAAGLSVDDIMKSNRGEAYFEHSNYVIEEGYKGPYLDINEEYSVNDMASQYGYIYFYFAEDEQQTAENLYNRRLQARDMLKEKNISFKSFTICYDISIGVYDLTYDELYSGNLEEIMAEKSVGL